ncbi:MAG TPA: SCP2 sterol-binding domain-containing protein [Alphaproteobacteria bacterium]|nr:SCP2 sterol-binding domain-containing protein [Alphaproteobacteria bacterium]HNS45511.1 SCP2 sterol-binding domain-containing protein [Alphaproteobacteria bacterium]
MSLETITEKLRQKMQYAAGFRHTVLFDLGEDGFIHIDGSESPPEMTFEDKDAEVTLECSTETLDAILDGSTDPNMAFLMRKLKIRGSMGLAMKLGSLLEG